MAFCNQCGTQIDDNATVCPACGAENKQETTPAAEPLPSFETPTEQLGATVSPSKVLTWGILGLAFSEVPFLNILGIIFSCVARKFANTFERERGMIFGQAKVGRILSLIGLINGIVMTVFWTLYLFAFNTFFFWILTHYNEFFLD